jgi:hypothetical protein
MPVPVENSKTQALLSILEEATVQRGRYYKQHLSFNIRFESDNTSAFRDAGHFRNMVQALGFPAPTELVIKDNNVALGWSVTDLISGIAHRAAEFEGRTLIIGHYAGHGQVGKHGLEFFAAPGIKQRFRYDLTLQSLYIEDNTFRDADVILILDSCYSGAATRDSPLTTRSVEVVAAVKATQAALGNDSEMARVQNHTFTSKLADLVSWYVGRGDSSISFVELISELRRVSHPERSPGYCLRAGQVGIRVPILARVSVFLPYRTPTPSNSPATKRRTYSIRGIPQISSLSAPTSNYMALFSVHIDDTDASSEGVRKLVEWVHSLDPSIGLEVTNVYQSHSTVIISYSPWSLWAQLNGLPEFSQICEAFGQGKPHEITSSLTNRSNSSNPS